MLVERNGGVPDVGRGASLAPTAVVVGDVVIAEGCYLGHGVVIESGGPPVRLERDVVVMPNTVIRSLGGKARPAFPVHVGAGTLIGPAVRARWLSAWRKLLGGDRGDGLPRAQVGQRIATRRGLDRARTD